MVRKIFGLLLVAVFVWGFQLVPVRAAAHALGSNIISPEGTVYTITKENSQTVRRPYTSSGAFLSFSYNTWETIVGASSDDMALPVGSFVAPQDGKIICSDRGADKGTCYLITSGRKAGFTNADVFRQLGYNFNYVMSGDVSFLPSTSNIDSGVTPHNSGALINKDGTIYLVGNNGLLGLPSWDVLKSWGYSSTDIIQANSADRNLAVVGTLVPKQPDQISPTNLPTPITNSKPTLIVSDSFVSFNYTRGGTVPQAYSAHISNNSNSQTINYTISVPNQPAWLNTSYSTGTLSLAPLQSAGVGISINPANLSAGTYTTTIFFTGNFANSPASIPITLVVTDVDPAASMTATSPTITGPSSVQAGTSANYYFVSTDQDASGYNGGLIRYTINWGDGTTTSSPTGFPSGVSYNASHTWQTAGSYSIAFTAIPALGSTASGIYMVQVANSPASANASINITAPQTGATWVVGQSYPITWNATGVSTVNIHIFKGDPTQCSFDSVGNLTCNYAVSESPRVVAMDVPNTGSYNYTVPSMSFTSGSSWRVVITGPGNKTLPGQSSSGYITISNGATSNPLQIVNSSLPDATAGQPYSQLMQASGGQAPYRWITVSTTYPAGCCALGLSGNNGSDYYGNYDPVYFNTQSGSTVLATYIGTYSWTIKATDANGSTATKTINLTINPGSPSLQITTSSLPNATVGQPYSSYQLQATGGAAPYSSWTIIDSNNFIGPGVCCMVSVDSNGLLRGSGNGITSSGTFYYTFQVTDANGKTATKTLNLTINPATIDIGLVNPGAITVTAPLGQYTKAFTLHSTTANSFYFYGYPTSYGAGINIAESSGGITPGGQIDIRVQINSNVPTGIYTGTVRLRTSDPGVSGEITFPITVNVTAG